MRFKINDKVIMPLAGNQVGTIIGIEKEIDDFNNAPFYVIKTEKGCLFNYYEDDVLPYTNQDSEKCVKQSKPILLVEDGSVDIDKLEEDGFYVIVYRKGSTPPMWLQSNDNKE